MSSRRSRARGSRGRQKQQSNTASNGGPTVDADGFIVKKSRSQQKKNSHRPKQAQKQQQHGQSPSKSNQSKSSRSRQRRKRAKQNRGNNHAASSHVSSTHDDEKQFVIDAIQHCYPTLTNRHVLHEVVKQLNLTSFNENDEELQVTLLALYQELKLMQVQQQLLPSSGTKSDDSKQMERNQDDDDYDDDRDQEEEEEEEDEEEDDVEEDEVEDEEDEYEEEEEEVEDEEEEEEEDDMMDEEEVEDEYEDEEEEEEDDVEEEEEEEEEEEKESSEPDRQKSDTRSMQDDEKKSEAESMSQRDQTQRKRNRRKRRRKKKSSSQSQPAQQQQQQQRQRQQQQQQQHDVDDEEEEEEDDQSQQPQQQDLDEMDDDTRSRSSRSKRQPKRRRGKKKVSLPEKLRTLDLNEIRAASQQINVWLQQLRNDRNQHFFNAFLKAHGVENIVEKVILQLGDQRPLNRGLSSLIIQLFDVMMSGTPDYHEWLFNQFVKLSADMKKLSSTKATDDADFDDNDSQSARDRNNAKKKKNEDGKAQLISVICEEARNLVHAQLKNLYNPNNKIVILKDMFERPSTLLHGGHGQSDPIVPALSALDNELEHVCDLYHDLRTHDSEIRQSCPTSSDAFRSEYNSIKQTLQTNMAFIQQRSQTLERKLYSMQSESDNLQRQQSEKLSPLKAELQSQEAERMHLMEQKRQIEQQLESINQQLSKCDMFIEQSKSHIEEIVSSFKPKTSRLFENVSDYRFEIAGFGQQSDCYSCLLSIVNQSYSSLDRWSRSQLQSDNDERSLVERNYINQLMVYLSKLCKAKKMVLDRVEQLKQHIDAIKRTNDIRAKNYGARHNQSNADEVERHIENLSKDIEMDEQTNENITKSIYKHIEKAHKIVSTQLFQQFINHIQQQPVITTYIDLSKYQISQRRQRQQQQQQQQKTSISTQTNTQQQAMQNMNGSHSHPVHARGHPPPRSHPAARPLHHAAPLQQQQQQGTQQQQHRLKPPIVMNKQANQNQNIPILKKPPRPHYNPATSPQSQQQQQQQQQQSSQGQPPRRRGPLYNAHHRQQF